MRHHLVTSDAPDGAAAHGCNQGATISSQRNTADRGLDVLPLHALLSAALVAFTVECDNEVERRLADRGRAGRFSLVAWLNVVQYLAAGPSSVAELCEPTSTETAQVAFAVGCLERWGFVSVLTVLGGSPRTTRAKGFGSARAITTRSTVDVTETGRVAVELWPGVIDDVEARWQRRHGSAMVDAVEAASPVAASPGVVMPEGLPSGWMKGDWRQLPGGTIEEPRRARLPVVLARALLAATIAYEQRTTMRLALAANTLRVIDDGGTEVSALHQRSGISPETTGAECTALQQFGLAELVENPSGRGKALRLTAAGRTAQAAHARTTEEVERAFGADGAQASRALCARLGGVDRGDLALRAALTPPPGVRRSGEPAPSLGRVTTRAAAIARNRALVAQTTAFLSDPFGALPHYPVWDGNRGFGP